MIAALYVGIGVRIRAKFTDPDTARPIDVLEPVTFTIKKPGGVTFEEEGVLISKGAYAVVFEADEPGMWHARVETSDVFPGVIEDEFRVRPSAF